MGDQLQKTRYVAEILSWIDILREMETKTKRECYGDCYELA